MIALQGCIKESVLFTNHFNLDSLLENHRSFLKGMLVVCALLFPFSVLAQTEMEDVVYLKDGGILRGEIVEMKENSVKIEIAGRNVIVINMKDVDEIKKEKKLNSQHFKKSGYINYTGLDILAGDENSTLFRYQMVNGYQFSPIFSGGLGIGFNSYNDPLNSIPIFIDMRLKFHEANTTPYFFIKTGYNFTFLPNDDLPIEKHSGGLMFNPGIGLQFDNSDAFGWYFNAGYNIDKMKYEELDWTGRTIETSLSYNRINFGFGLAF